MRIKEDNLRVSGIMTVGVVGLGLIGGSFAKAYSENGEHRVWAYDINPDVMKDATEQQVVDGELNRDNISECDLVLVALYPEATVQYIEKMSPYIGSSTVVVDCCGVKGYVCERCFPLAEKYGFTYVGGHPMAGRHFSGYDYSTRNMYNGASMVLVPRDTGDEALIERVKILLSPIRFGKFAVCDADYHDRQIAFTSQMAHVVSNAYVKSPTAKTHDGFSAGSYKDLTRVAWLNEVMWTELFMANKKHLIEELDYFIESLKQYKTAMETDDPDMLRELLAEGKRCKENIDGIGQ